MYWRNQWDAGQLHVGGLRELLEQSFQMVALTPAGLRASL